MVTRRELALRGVTGSSVRRARADPLEAHWKSIWLRARHTENHQEASPLFPRVILFLGHGPGKRSRGSAEHRPQGGHGAEQKAAEGPGPDDLTLVAAVSAGAGLWPGASPRTRLSS